MKWRKLHYVTATYEPPTAEAPLWCDLELRGADTGMLRVPAFIASALEDLRRPPVGSEWLTDVYRRALDRTLGPIASGRLSLRGLALLVAAASEEADTSPVTEAYAAVER